MYLNSESYWENRFKTDWKEQKGVEQSLIHYETIIAHLPQWIKDLIEDNTYSICDMGCGMGEGANELHKTFPKSEVYGMDFSQTAIDEANKQYKDENLTYFKGDMCDCDEKFDIIVSNPPYIKTSVIKTLDSEVQKEPKLALDGGVDGLKFYREIINNAYKYLKNEGYLCLEIGYDQRQEVIDLIEKSNKYIGIYSKKDLAGLDRVVVCKKRGEK